VVVHDHVAWRIDLGQRRYIAQVNLRIGVRNFSSATVRGLYVGDSCPLARAEAYRDGEWDHPVWVEPDTTACPAVPRRPLLLPPGDSTNAYYWNRWMDAHQILGDSLPTDDYRIGVRDVPLDPLPDSVYERGGEGWNPARAELVAPEPVHLIQAHPW